MGRGESASLLLGRRVSQENALDSVDRRTLAALEKGEQPERERVVRLLASLEPAQVERYTKEWTKRQLIIDTKTCIQEFVNKDDALREAGILTPLIGDRRLLSDNITLKDEEWEEVVQRGVGGPHLLTHMATKVWDIYNAAKSSAERAVDAKGEADFQDLLRVNNLLEESQQVWELRRVLAEMLLHSFENKTRPWAGRGDEYFQEWVTSLIISISAKSLDDRENIQLEADSLADSLCALVLNAIAADLDSFKGLRVEEAAKLSRERAKQEVAIALRLLPVWERVKERYGDLSEEQVREMIDIHLQWYRSKGRLSKDLQNKLDRFRG